MGYLECNFDAKSHLGRKRKNNEDYVAFHVPPTEKERNEQGSLFVVADGVGGASKGEDASQFAAEKVLYEYYKQISIPFRERLIAVIQQANLDIYTYSQESSAGRMATTLVAALVINNQLYIANIGDSRAYVLRGGKINQISRDHNYVGELVSQGMLTEEEALHSNAKNKLSRCIGAEMEVDVDLFGPLPMQLNDRILLCTDGLSRYALLNDLAGFAGKGTLTENTNRMIKFALDKGGADNVSMILIEMVEKSTTKLRSPIEHVGRKTAVSSHDAPTEHPVLRPLSNGARRPVRRAQRGISPVAIVISVVCLLAALFSAWYFLMRTEPIQLVTTISLPTSQPVDLTTALPIVQGYIPGDIRSLALSPDGKTLVVGTYSNGISLIDMETSNVYQTIGIEKVKDVVFADDHTFISASDDGFIRQWISDDKGRGWLEDEPASTTHNHTDTINAIELSFDKVYLVTASADKTVQIWKVIRFTPQPALSNHIDFTSNVTSIDLSPVANKLVTGTSEGVVTEWNLEASDYQPIKKISSESGSPVTAVLYNWDGTCIAAGFGNGEIIEVCNSSNSEGMITHKLPGYITDIAYERNSNQLASTSSGTDDIDGEINIWSGNTIVFNHSVAIVQDKVIFSSDGSFLLTGSMEKGINMINTWEITQMDASTAIPVLAPTATITPNPTEEEKDTSQPTEIPATPDPESPPYNWECVTEIRSNLSNTLIQFGINFDVSYNPENEYKVYEACDVTAETIDFKVLDCSFQTILTTKNEKDQLKNTMKYLVIFPLDYGIDTPWEKSNCTNKSAFINYL